MTTSRGEMRHDHADRDPGPEIPWEPTSHKWAREQALQATREAVARANGKPAGEEGR